MIAIRHLSRMTPEDLILLKKRAEVSIEAALTVAREIVEEIAARGDEALLRYTRRHDYAGAELASLKVKEDEFAKAQTALPSKVKEALVRAHANITKLHQKQMPQELWLTEVDDGVFAGEKVTSIHSAGLYVPRGKGAFPSVMLMLAIPAMVAGVEKVVVCTPPNEQGQVDAASLVAADICGIKHIYKLGGAQAIAALALGTATVPRVDKIIGPGNTFVSAAKRLLFGKVDVGLPAGPSEAIILADESTDPRLAAVDLLNEAEHGPDSASLLVTHSENLANEVVRVLPQYLKPLPTWRREFCEKVLANHGGVLLTASLDESIDFVNDYAPEHLAVLTREPFALLGRIKNAGEVLLGPYSPIAAGNYCLGTNAILPTGGFAKSFSAVSVFDFLKRSGIGYVMDKGYARLKEIGWQLAEYEGFPAHAQALKERETLLK